MNYIELINNFWLAHEEHQFDRTEISLFFQLLKINNSLKWCKTFKRNNNMVAGAIGVTKPILARAKKTLKDAGLIDYRATIGSSNTEYAIFDLAKKSKGFDKGSDAGSDTGTDGGYSAGHDKHNINNKLNKTKENVYRAFAHLQIFDDEVLKLRDEGYTQEQIDNVLDAIENFKGNKKYGSLFITASQWLKKEKSSAKKENPVQVVKNNIGKTQPPSAEQMNEARRSKIMEGWRVFKETNGCHDSAVWDSLFQMSLLSFTKEQNTEFLTLAIAKAEERAGPNEIQRIISLKASGKIGSDKMIEDLAKRIAAAEYFRQLVAEQKDITNLIN